MDLGIEGKRALVLASSRGLGFGIAQALAREGAHVLLCGRDDAHLASARDAIATGGRGWAEVVRADLAETGSVEALTRAVAQALGGLDILVNNTGGPPPGTAEEMESEALHEAFETMVLRVIALTRAVLPGMKAQGWGRVLTVASSSVFEPIDNLALSNTVRPALVGWSKTLASEVARHGVTVNMLLPGSILTARLDELDSAISRRTGTAIEEVRRAKEARIPARRYGTVEEFGAVAAFLCSAQASYVTGSMVRCDGGAARSV